MTKLAIEPAEEGYSVSFPAQARTDPVEGGPSRRRREIAGARPRVTVQWYTDRAGYDYLQAFYRTAARRGAEAFEIDLIVDSPNMIERTAFIAPGSFTLSRVAGPTHMVAAELEVAFEPADVEYDETIMDLFEVYGSEMSAAMSALERLVNIDLPGAGW